MRNFIRFCFFGVVILFEPVISSGQPADSVEQEALVELPSSTATITRGKSLFLRHCSICHALEHELIGPAMVSIPQKRPLPWLIDFIRNSQKVIKSGDEYAVNLYENYDRVIMPAFEFLSDDEILAILGYIHSESVPDDVRVGANPTHIDESGAASSVSGSGYTTGIDEKYREDVREVGIWSVAIFIVIIASLAILTWLGIKIFKHVR